MDENLTVCSFVKSSNLFLYSRIKNDNAEWIPEILKNQEDILEAVTRASNARNGEFAIALLAADCPSDKLQGKCRLTEEQAFGSYIQLFEYVDGDLVIYEGNAR
jgi:hypothetical protein